MEPESSLVTTSSEMTFSSRRARLAMCASRFTYSADLLPGLSASPAFTSLAARSPARRTIVASSWLSVPRSHSFAAVSATTARRSCAASASLPSSGAYVLNAERSVSRTASTSAARASARIACSSSTGLASRALTAPSHHPPVITSFTTEDRAPDAAASKTPA